jgi:hypothetical protein
MSIVDLEGRRIKKQLFLALVVEYILNNRIELAPNWGTKNEKL